MVFFAMMTTTTIMMGAWRISVGLRTSSLCAPQIAWHRESHIKRNTQNTHQNDFGGACANQQIRVGCRQWMMGGEGYGRCHVAISSSAAQKQLSRNRSFRGKPQSQSVWNARMWMIDRLGGRHRRTSSNTNNNNFTISYYTYILPKYKRRCLGSGYVICLDAFDVVDCCFLFGLPLADGWRWFGLVCFDEFELVAIVGGAKMWPQSVTFRDDIVCEMRNGSLSSECFLSVLRNIDRL